MLFGNFVLMRKRHRRYRHAKKRAKLRPSIARWYVHHQQSLGGHYVHHTPLVLFVSFLIDVLMRYNRSVYKIA